MRNIKFCFVYALCGCMIFNVAGEAYERKFKELPGPVPNPGQGWMAWQCSGWKSTSAKVSVGMIYDRFYWSDFEPENGVYDWAKIEEHLEFAKSKGIPAAFRIICASSIVGRC